MPPDMRRRLCPAVEMGLYTLGNALRTTVGPINPKGLSPEDGHSPEIIWLLSAGHHHRRTSGGTAEADVPDDI